MKIDTVLTAVNLNNEYLVLIPNFIKHWEGIFKNINIKIILIGSDIPSDYKKYSKYITLFNEIPNIPTSFQAMCIRELYPCIVNSNNGVIITDIDMMPMNCSYFEEPIKDIPNNKFVIYRDVLKDEYPMCYNIATPEVWSNVFNIKNETDIHNELIRLYNKQISIPYSNFFDKYFFHNIDQKNLFDKLNIFNNQTNNLVILTDEICKFNRLNRDGSDINDDIVSNIKNKVYSDFHCYRVYQDNWEEKNNKIMDILLNSLHY